MGKINYLNKAYVLYIGTILLQLFFVPLSAQIKWFKGIVTKADGTPLSGAALLISGTKKGVKTNEHGLFSINNTGAKKVVVSYIGFVNKTILLDTLSNNTSIVIILDEDNNEGDAVVVTGAFDKRKRMDASVAISTINTQQLERTIPLSAPDLLKAVPGVFVNSSGGEIRNSVSSRGITIGSTDGSFGYEYVSMQEDGLPITNTTYFSYGPDFFLRADATLDRLDAVRGGTASIAAANAPGGIFNYISKTGGSSFAGEIRTRYGLVGNGDKSLGRVDADFGGPLGKNWFYNIGGFYRYDQGARYAGYPMNVGGQVKGNLVKKYSKGSIKIFGKFLDDRNTFAQPIPTLGYNDPAPAPGFNNNSTVLPPQFEYTSSDLLNGGTLHFNSKNLVTSKYRSGGFVWEHNLGKGYTFSNSARYSDNHILYNTAGSALPQKINDITAYYLLSGFPGLGNYSFKDIKTSEEVANVTFTGTAFNINKSSLPGQSVLANSVMVVPLSFYDNHVNEFMDQFVFNKKINKMNFTLGGYFGYTNANRYSGGDVAIETVEPRPRLLSLSFTGLPYYGINSTTGVPILGAAGTYQLTNSSGIGQLAGNQGAFIGFSAKQNQGAVFFAHTWQLSDKLTFDWGIRSEKVNIKGLNRRPNLKITGGSDNDAFTLYNNNTLDTIGYYRFDYTINTFSFSGALNYKVSNHFSIYGRYSQGKKAPDLDFYFTLNTPNNLKFYRPHVRTTQQGELGFKVNVGNTFIFATPFYSLLSGVPVGQIFQNTDGSYYFPPANYEKYRTIGLELEANVAVIKKYLNIRAVATLQKSKLKSYNILVANNPGAADDSTLSYTGKETDNTPRIITNITPTATFGKFYTLVTWSLMGSRWANAANIFKMPAFSQFDFSAGYDLSKHLQLSANINNLFNKYGVMSWQRPGGISDVLSGNASFSKSQYEAAVAANTPYATIAIQPRAAFLSLVYKF